MSPRRTPADDAKLAAELAARRARVRAQLQQDMAQRGLFEDEGWRIHEFTRHRHGGVEIVMRPVHVSKPTPEDLECIVSITSSGDIDGEC